jgi:transposase
MRQKSMSKKDSAEKAIRDIRRKTRRLYSSEEKIRIVLEGLRQHKADDVTPSSSRRRWAN